MDPSSEVFSKLVDELELLNIIEGQYLAVISIQIYWNGWKFRGKNRSI